SSVTAVFDELLGKTLNGMFVNNVSRVLVEKTSYPSASGTWVHFKCTYPGMLAADSRGYIVGALIASMFSPGCSFSPTNVALDNFGLKTDTLSASGIRM
ncbi:MAG: hypothetical protein ACLQRM_03210, partial [Acidimicrobiales bacterium]